MIYEKTADLRGKLQHYDALEDRTCHCSTQQRAMPGDDDDAWQDGVELGKKKKGSSELVCMREAARVFLEVHYKKYSNTLA